MPPPQDGPTGRSLPTTPTPYFTSNSLNRPSNTAAMGKFGCANLVNSRANVW